MSIRRIKQNSKVINSVLQLESCIPSHQFSGHWHYYISYSIFRIPCNTIQVSVKLKKVDEMYSQGSISFTYLWCYIYKPMNMNEVNTEELITVWLRRSLRFTQLADCLFLLVHSYAHVIERNLMTLKKFDHPTLPVL